MRRAIGAKRRDVIRQFLIETTIISLAGGIIGVLIGVGLSQLIGYLAGWSTIVTTWSIVLAFFVSVAHRSRLRAVSGRARRGPRSGQGSALRVAVFRLKAEATRERPRRTLASQLHSRT